MPIKQKPNATTNNGGSAQTLVVRDVEWILQRSEEDRIKWLLTDMTESIACKRDLLSKERERKRKVEDDDSLNAQDPKQARTDTEPTTAKAKAKSKAAAKRRQRPTPTPDHTVQHQDWRFFLDDVVSCVSDSALPTPKQAYLISLALEFMFKGVIKVDDSQEDMTIC